MVGQSVGLLNLMFIMQQIFLVDIDTLSCRDAGIA